MHETRAKTDALALHAGHDHIAAVFPSRDAAAAAIADLRQAGLGSEHLGVAVQQSDRVIFEHDKGADLTRDTLQGSALGAGVGYLAGLALFAAAVPGIGLGGLLALAGGTAFGGGMVGGYVGLGEGNVLFSERLDLETHPLEPGEILVVACSHDQPDAVRSALQGHGGQLIDTKT